MIGSCKLCEKEAELCKSHVYPKFVVNWIKKTSPTGFLRNPTSINIRNQDGPKEFWFCRNCEQLLSDDEKKFSEKVFVPYTNAVEKHDYSDLFEGEMEGDFILRFAIGLQYRTILANTKILELKEDNIDLITQYKEKWKNYLLKLDPKTGNCETHIFFFTSLEGAVGEIPGFEFAPNVNVYLIRSMDNTIIDSVSGDILGVFCKIGPIGFITAIKPRRLKYMENTKISLKRNKLTCSQKYGNESIVRFLWIDRPIQLLSVTQSLSEKQKEKIDRSYEKDLERVKNSLGEKMKRLDRLKS